MKNCILASACLIIGLAYGEESAGVKFATVEQTVKAQTLLHEIGLKRFMERVWHEGVGAPAIHSRFWIDRIMKKDDPRRNLESSYRDFGKELAIQIDDLAINIWENPVKGRELEDFDFLMRLAKWMEAPRKFENFRVGMRVENAATMPLHRMIFNFGIENSAIEERFEKFMSKKESAKIRAEILREESDGCFDMNILDVWREANTDSACFAIQWGRRLSKAYSHFGGRMLEYSKSEEVRTGDLEYTFFMEDYSLNLENTTVDRWDVKCHHLVCQSCRPRALNALGKAFGFRKEVGKFPDVEVPDGDDIRHAYKDYYLCNFNLYKKVTKIPATTVATTYVDYKENSYTDKETYRRWSQRKR